MTTRSQAVLSADRDARELVLDWRGVRSPGAFQWIHLCSLFLLLSVVGAAGLMLVDGLTAGASVARLPALLYWWVPSALGIVVAASPVRHSSLARVSLLVVIGVATLVTLDLLGAALESWGSLRWAVLKTTGETVLRPVGGPYPESWVAALWSWASGSLTGVSETFARAYPAGHPRSYLAHALAESSAVFLAVATIGAVMATRRWIDRNVILRNPSNDLAIGAALGWIVAPSVTALGANVTDRAMTSAMFGGQALWVVPLPCAVLAALGVLGLVYAFRREQ